MKKCVQSDENDRFNYAEFVEQFHAHGFRFVEGSKWVNMIDTETYSSRDSYKTYPSEREKEERMVIV